MTFIQSRTSFAENDNCTSVTLPFLAEWNGAPVSKARADFGDLVLVWDTGAAVSVIRRKAAEDANATILNQSVSIQHLRLGDTDFGPIDLRVFDYAARAGTDGFIGHDFFANHVVCIDFPGKRILVRRRPRDWPPDRRRCPQEAYRESDWVSGIGVLGGR